MDNFTLEFQEWAGDISRYEDPTRWQGIFVRDLTDEGKKKRWIGTIRLRNDSGAKFTDSVTQRFISNFYNRKKTNLRINIGGSEWTYNSATPRRANNNDSSKIELVTCSNDMVCFTGRHFAFTSTAAGNAMAAIGVDSTSSVSADSENIRSNWNEGEKQCPNIHCNTTLSPGYHYAYLLEWSDQGVTVTFRAYSSAYMGATFDY